MKSQHLDDAVDTEAAGELKQTKKCPERSCHTSAKYRREPTKAVCRRNERERNRVKQVNLSFEKLRNHVPPGEKSKKLSKMDTLRSAVAYIKYLKDLLGGSPNSTLTPSPSSLSLFNDDDDDEDDELQTLPDTSPLPQTDVDHCSQFIYHQPQVVGTTAIQQIHQHDLINSPNSVSADCLAQSQLRASFDFYEHCESYSALLQEQQQCYSPTDSCPSEVNADSPRIYGSVPWSPPAPASSVLYSEMDNNFAHSDLPYSDVDSFDENGNDAKVQECLRELTAWLMQ